MTIQNIPTSPEPTEEFYAVLQQVFQEFNNTLFDGTLPNCLITVQRKKKVMGYFSADRWTNEQEKRVHEIALNPSFFASCNFIEIFQTIAHEMCHLWQHEYGSPSRSNYHNKEWGDKMESIGLIPSKTGRPGGKKTGQSMNDYPEPKGKFEKVCTRLYQEGLFVKWYDRFPEENQVFSLISQDQGNDALQMLYTSASSIIKDTISTEEIKANAIKKQKTKYRCRGCKATVWGKPNLNLHCKDCKLDFEICKT